MCFMSYYYSPYFTKYSADKHESRYAYILNKIAPAFCDEADVWFLLNHILDTMLAFAVKVFNGYSRENDDVVADHVFNFVYSGLEPYLKNK